MMDEDTTKPVPLDEDYSLERSDEIDTSHNIQQPARIFDSHNSGDSPSKPWPFYNQFRTISESISPRTRKALLTICAFMLLLCVIAAVLLLALYAPDTNGPDPTNVYYYIQAEKVIWDFAPSGKDLLRGGVIPLTKMKASEMPSKAPNKKRVKRGDGKKGKSGDKGNGSGSSSGDMIMGEGPWITTKWAKAVYRQYTDDTFTTPVERSPEEVHLGLLGPIIRAQVGDTITVVFKNTLDFPASVHPHGVLYQKEFEGASYLDTPEELASGNPVSPSKHQARGVVDPGETFTYVWSVPERAGPLSNGPSSMVWLYHSHASEIKDVNTGLVGPIIITRKGAATEDRKPKDVDNEWVLFSMIFDEMSSHYVAENSVTQGGGKSMDKDDGMGGMNMDGNETMSTMDWDNLFIVHAMNGFLSSNIPVLTGNVGETSRWYMMGLGGEMDIHTVHTHGNTMIDRFTRVDTTILLPGVSTTADMLLDNPGMWLYHCHTSSHTTRMTGLYQVVDN